jgi:hypothetical protein
MADFMEQRLGHDDIADELYTREGSGQARNDVVDHELDPGCLIPRSSMVEAEAPVSVVLSAADSLCLPATNGLGIRQHDGSQPAQKLSRQ